jgi:hypothetical protein
MKEAIVYDTGDMFKTVMASIGRYRDNKVTFSIPPRVSLDSEYHGGVARRRQESVAAHAFLLT